MDVVNGLLMEQYINRKMNKALRHEIKMRKYRRRVSLLGYDHTSLRTTGRPCNCWMCRKPKYERHIENRKIQKDLGYK